MLSCNCAFALLGLHIHGNAFSTIIEGLKQLGHFFVAVGNHSIVDWSDALLVLFVPCLVYAHATFMQAAPYYARLGCRYKFFCIVALTHCYAVLSLQVVRAMMCTC